MNKNPPNKRKLVVTNNAKPSKIRRINTTNFVKSANDDDEIKINVKEKKKLNIEQNGKNNPKGKEPEEVEEEDIESMDESDEVESNASSEEINNESDNDSEAEVNSNDDDNDDDNDSSNELAEESDFEENELGNSIVSNNGSNLEEDNDSSNELAEESDFEENELGNSIVSNNGSNLEEEENTDEENDHSDEENDNSGDEENDNSVEEENDNEENDNSDDEENDNTNEKLVKDTSEEEYEINNQSNASYGTDFDFTSNDSVFVRGIKGVSINDIFFDCSIETFNMLPNKFFKNVENAVVKFKDNESYKRALQKNNCNFNGSIIAVKPHYSRNEFEEKYKLSVTATGIPRNLNIREFFNDCQIQRMYRPPKVSTNLGLVNIWFADMESVKKALAKDGTKINENIIRVRYRCYDKCVYVRALREDINVEDIFKDCKILHYESTYLPRLQHKSITIYFEDEESVERALSKNDTEFDGHILDIKRRKCILLVTGLKTESTIEKLFDKEEIMGYKLIKTFDETFEGKARVFFKNRESVQKALQKNETVVDGNKVFITFFEPHIHKKFNTLQNRTSNDNTKFNKFQNPNYNNKFNKFQRPTNDYNNRFNKFQRPTMDYNNRFNKFQRPTIDYNNRFNKFQRPTNDYNNKFNKFQRPTNDYNKFNKFQSPINDYNNKLNQFLKPTNNFNNKFNKFQRPTNDDYNKSNKFQKPPNDDNKINENQKPIIDDNNKFNENQKPIIDDNNKLNENQKPTKNVNKLKKNQKPTYKIKKPSKNDKKLKKKEEPVPVNDLHVKKLLLQELKRQALEVSRELRKLNKK